METQMGTMTVQQIIHDYEQNVITVNHEYQRGEAWNDDQRKRLVDSLFRGYQLPIFYLHEIERGNALGDKWRVHQIIDGQQRCEALKKFIYGDLQLLEVEDEASKLPAFLRDTEKYPCPWSGQRYISLPTELRDQLNNAELQIAFIKDADDAEVRDLFIRLQSGSPLNNQEKRDAYPGEFTDFINKLGGKDSLDLNGYDFFKKIIQRPSGSDRGQIRTLAAQITILLLERRNKGGVVNIGRGQIDEYYDTRQDFDASSPDCQQLLAVIRKLESILGSWTGPKLQRHIAICAVLFMDSILNDYTAAWEASFEKALKDFAAYHAKGRQANRDRQYHPAWQEYGQYTSASADSQDSVRRRQEFFDSCMMAFLGDSLVPKDPQRIFNDVEKQAIYWLDYGKCGVCEGEVKAHEAVYHHVVPHGKGGKTIVDNGALVHYKCHPLSDEAVAAFAEMFRNKERKVTVKKSD